MEILEIAADFYAKEYILQMVASVLLLVILEGFYILVLKRSNRKLKIKLEKESKSSNIYKNAYRSKLKRLHELEGFMGDIRRKEIQEAADESRRKRGK